MSWAERSVLVQGEECTRPLRTDVSVRTVNHNPNRTRTVHHLLTRRRHVRVGPGLCLHQGRIVEVSHICLELLHSLWCHLSPTCGGYPTRRTQASRNLIRRLRCVNCEKPSTSMDGKKLTSNARGFPDRPRILVDGVIEPLASRISSVRPDGRRSLPSASTEDGCCDELTTPGLLSCGSGMAWRFRCFVELVFPADDRLSVCLVYLA